jgi:hypothetical protein
MLGGFNVPGYDWINGPSLANSYYYKKIQENAIDTVVCFLGLDQSSNSVINRALHYLAFTNISYLSTSISSSPVVTAELPDPRIAGRLMLQCDLACLVF